MHALASDSPTDRAPQLCKQLPEVMEMYKLDELITKGTLQASLKDMFYQNARFSDPNMVRVMVHKANEELQVSCGHTLCDSLPRTRPTCFSRDVTYPGAVQEKKPNDGMFARH